MIECLLDGLNAPPVNNDDDNYYNNMTMMMAIDTILSNEVKLFSHPFNSHYNSMRQALLSSFTEQKAVAQKD
jgi:hypothetical protein